MTKAVSFDDARELLDSDPAAAEKAARAIVVNRPNDWQAILLLARSLRAQGKIDEAVKTERRVVAVATTDPRHRSAAREMQQGRAFEANTILKKLLDADPDDILAAVMLGLQASKANEFELADQLLRHAATLTPGDPGTRLALADHYFRSKRFAAALDELRSLDETDQQTEAAQNLIANCLGEVGQVEEQLAIYEALSAKAADPLAFNLKIGLALRTLGRFDEAAKAFRAVVARVPAEGTSWHNLSNLKVEKFSDKDIAQMEAGLKLTNAPIENHIRLNFALGKAFEDRGNAEKAFLHYNNGNRLRESIAPYMPEMITQWVERSEAAFTAEFFEKRRDWGNPAPDPIFV
ncbi:MAG: tetratricopeptide repeat protein, partial [Sphingomicrobium sp.]